MGPAGHLAYVGWAYGATAIAVVVLVARAVLDHRAQIAALARLENPATRARDDAS